MAGEWIKIEKATLRKTEVVKLARILGVTRQHAVGLCVEFWSWCDSNLTDAFITGSSKEDIDFIMETPGFAAAMIVVDWIREAEGILSVTHFDYHLSAGAKIRAQSVNRSQKYRANTENGVKTPTRKSNKGKGL